MAETLFDKENWRLEGAAVAKDVGNHVKLIKLIDGTDQSIFMNITTKEGKNYCVELSSNGFRIVGNEHDCKKIASDEYYETPYSLLNSISKEFQQSFGNELIDKLNKLKQ